MLGSQTVGTRHAHSLWERVWAARVHIVWAQLAGIAAIYLAISFGREVDPDYWWHLRTGELIVTSGIPTVDPFSWSAHGNEWVTHEWLSEATIYLVQSVLGYPGVVLLFGGATAAAVGLMYALARRSGAGTKVLVLLTLLSTVLFGFFITPRPQTFTWLLFAAFVYLIQRREEGERAPVWALPALTALWVNLHLGFVYGLLVVGVWLAGRVYERARRRDVDLREPALVLAGCALAALLNPEGVGIYAYVIDYASQGELERSVIQEWQRPYFGQPVVWPLIVASLVMTAALLSRRGLRPFLVLLSVVALVLSTQASRNVPYVALLLIPVAASAAAARWPGARRGGDSTVRVSWVHAMAFAGGIGALTVFGAANLHGALSGWAPSQQGYPSSSAAYVREHLPGAHLLNEYSWGGFLIEELYPDARVFIDGRADLYGPEPVRDYLTLVGAEPGWQALLAEYEVDAVLLPPDYPLSYLLARDPAWTLAVDEPDEQLFVPH